MELTFHIAGIPHRKPDLTLLKVGDEMQLLPEPTNAYDPNAIKIMFKDIHFGYVPKTETANVRNYSMTKVFVHDINPSRKWSEVVVGKDRKELESNFFTDGEPFLQPKVAAQILDYEPLGDHNIS